MGDAFKFVAMVGELVILTLPGCNQTPQAGTGAPGGTPNPWTLEQITAARESCAARSAELGAVDPLKLAAVCSCAVEDAARRWSSDDWLRNATIYTQLQVRDGTVEKCRVAASPSVGGSTWSQAEIAQVRQICVAFAKQMRPTANEAAVILGCGCVAEDASKKWEFPDYIKNEAAYTRKQINDGTMAQCMAGNGGQGDANQSAAVPPPISANLHGVWETACIQATQNRSLRSRWEVGGDRATYRVTEYMDEACGAIMRSRTDIYTGKSEGGSNGDYSVDLVREDAYAMYADPTQALAACLGTQWGYNRWPIWTYQKVTDRQRGPGLTPEYPLNERRYDLFRVVGDRLYLGDSNETENRRSPDKRPKDAYMLLAFIKSKGTNSPPTAGAQSELSQKIGGTANDYPVVSDPDGDGLTVSCVGACPEGLTVAENFYSYTPAKLGTTTANMVVRDAKGAEKNFTLRLVANKEFQVYRDIDGDGYGAGALLTVAAPLENIPSGYVTNGTDCDDTDETKWRLQHYAYRDIDGDGYTVSTSPGSICIGAAQLPTYVSAENGSDCDDTDPQRHLLAAHYYLDRDGNGLGVPGPGLTCTNDPAPYLLHSPSGNDQLEYHPSSLTVGLNHTCFLEEDGAIKCWGGNAYTQLGIQTNIQKLIPQRLQYFPIGVVQIESGEDHTCVLTDTGAVSCWGRNHYGQLGDGSYNDRNSPWQVPNLTSGVVAISAGARHTCALKESGLVLCWGKSDMLGIGPPGGASAVLWPVKVPLLNSKVVAISAADNHSCALLVTGGVSCWGYNYGGALGDGTSYESKPWSALTDVAGLATGVLAITSGSMHSCALLNTGAVKCWGSNASGQLGDGTTIDRHTPTQVMDLSSGVVSIQAGISHTCALLITGSVKCWGSNGSGQIGDGTTTSTPVPTQVAGLSSGVVGISVYNHSCALLSTGSLRCWGPNSYGGLGNGTTNQSLTPVDVIDL